MGWKRRFSSTYRHGMNSARGEAGKIDGRAKNERQSNW